MRELLEDANYINLAITQTIRHSYREQYYGSNIWPQIVRSYVDIRSKLQKIRKKYQIQMQIVGELHDNLDIHYHMLVTVRKSNKVFMERLYKKLFDEVGNYKIKTIDKLQGWMDYLSKKDKKDITEYTPLTTKYLLDTYGLNDCDDTLEDRYNYFINYLKDEDDIVEGGNMLKYYFNCHGLEQEYEIKMQNKINA